jgi:pyruvate dehydrogenase E1 component beta subunit
MVKLALQAASSLEERGVDVEVIDPLTLEPLDTERIVESVRKTGRLVVVDEDTDRCGVGAEIAMQVVERAFASLKAAPERVGNPNLPVPYSPILEAAVLPSKEKIEEAMSRPGRPECRAPETRFRDRLPSRSQRARREAPWGWHRLQTLNTVR